MIRHLIGRGDVLVFPKKVCDKTEEHEPHVWHQLHIPTGNPLVEYDQWWQCGEDESGHGGHNHVPDLNDYCDQQRGVEP